MDDFERVVAAAREGEPWAMTRLYRQYEAAVIRYLRARVREDADDLAADVWVEVARSLKRFEGDEAHFRGWLFTIVRRRLADSRRRRFRRRTDPVADVPDYLAPAEGADVAAVAGDATRRALALVNQLPADQADVVFLRVMAGLDTETVASIVGKSPGAVRVIQHRALQRLAAIVGEGL